jgi:hypothetical protein
MQREKVEAWNGGNRPSLEKNDDELDLDIAAGPAPQVLFASPWGIALEQFDWGHPSEFETAWLTKRGVSFKALMGDWPVGAANVNFDGKGHFNLVNDGERALTFVGFNTGDPIDIMAWRPKSGQIASYTGAATFLGDQDDLINPATWFDGGDLVIHASPLEWLQRDREGLVIVNFKRAGACLRNVKSVYCEDINVARKIRRTVKAACKPIVKIYTAAPKRGKATS